jgi:arsenite methyltransferase
MVTYSDIPEGLRQEAALYAGCVSGALVREAYLQLIKEAGFTNIKVQKERKIELPDEMLSKYMSAAEVANFKRQFAGIASITVYGEKPCCETISNCC